MRALFKELLKGAGTPVLQRRDADGETIISAANIWTSAHARRIELRERGLAEGDVLRGEAPDGFRAAIDFVACAIGGFVYFPAEGAPPTGLRDEIAVTPGARLVLPGAEPAILTDETIASELARLSREPAPAFGGARMSCRASYCDRGLVDDLLLGLVNRQTIYLRGPDWLDHEEGMAELAALGLDELVLAPAMLDRLDDAGPKARDALSRIRLDCAGLAFTPAQRKLAKGLFAAVVGGG